MPTSLPAPDMSFLLCQGAPNWSCLYGDPIGLQGDGPELRMATISGSGQERLSESVTAYWGDMAHEIRGMMRS